jgi:hypothetical protein
MSNDQLADFRLNTIGFVFQDYHLFPRLTTAENVAIPLILKARDWNESIAAADQMLEIVGLKGRGRDSPGQAFGRRAAARGDRTRHRQRPGDPDPRRTDRLARRRHRQDDHRFREGEDAQRRSAAS